MHCRTCFEILESKEVNKYYDIKDKITSYGVTLAHVLRDLTGLCLERNDSAETELVCVSCSQSLISFYKFRQKVIDTDRRFKKLKVQDKIQDVEEILVEVKLEEVKMEIEHNESNDEKANMKELEFCQKKRRKVSFLYKRNSEDFFECPKENCPGLFKNSGHLESHLENMHSETDQLFPCKTCGEEFTTLLLLKRHYYKIHAPRPYKCDICGNDYPFKGSLRTHMRFHVKGKRVDKTRQACSVCRKVFSNEGCMLKHRKEVHFPKELVPKPFICNVCGSYWATKSKLVAHMKFHAAPEFTCEICSKSFCVKGSLVQHRQSVHLDMRPFFCDICGKKCKTKGQLKNHQSRHSDERPFKCQKCPSTFKLKFDLSEHQSKTHTSADPLTCNVCGKLFKGKSTLRVHMALHYGEDHKCPHCNTTYKDKGALRFHVRTIHLGFKKRHACPICKINLSSRKQIVDHLEQTHKNALMATNKKPEELVQSYWTSDPSGANLGEEPPVVTIIKSV